MNGSMNSGVLVWCIEFRTGCNTHFSIEKKSPEKKNNQEGGGAGGVLRAYFFENDRLIAWKFKICHFILLEMLQNHVTTIGISKRPKTKDPWWKFHPHDFFLITPEIPLNFFVDAWNFPILFFNTPGYSNTPDTPWRYVCSIVLPL